MAKPLPAPGGEALPAWEAAADQAIEAVEAPKGRNPEQGICSQRCEVVSTAPRLPRNGAFEARQCTEILHKEKLP